MQSGWRTLVKICRILLERDLSSTHSWWVCASVNVGVRAREMCVCGWMREGVSRRDVSGWMREGVWVWMREGVCGSTTSNCECSTNTGGWLVDRSLVGALDQVSRKNCKNSNTFHLS
jgi:hypothetical protein